MTPGRGAEGAAVTPGPRNCISDIAGIRVGHDTQLSDHATMADPAAGTLGTGAATGTTVVLAPAGTVGSVDVRGGGPGTRETDALAPQSTVTAVHAVTLAGGSAYGLAAADGVMLELEERGHGLSMGGPESVVPIVPAAVIFDLPVGDWQTRPDRESGRRAARNAFSAAGSAPLGSVGAGTGARAGRLKGGVGSASLIWEGRYTVGALVVANPVGEVLDPRTGRPWAEYQRPGYRGHLPLPRLDPEQLARLAALPAKDSVLNTTIGVIATDAPLSVAGCQRLAVAAQAGLAQAVRPAHSPLDGDTFFALATGGAGLPPVPDSAQVPGIPAETALLTTLCELASAVVATAVVRAVAEATPVAGINSWTRLSQL